MSVRSGKKRPRKNGKVDPKILADVIRRVVAAAHPERIILFGSAARGEMGPDSDLDLLVVKRGKFDRRLLTNRIRRNLRGADSAVDLVIVTPEEVERYRNSFCLVVAPALAEGKTVYAS